MATAQHGAKERNVTALGTPKHFEEADCSSVRLGRRVPVTLWLLDFHPAEMAAGRLVQGL